MREYPSQEGKLQKKTPRAPSQETTDKHSSKENPEVGQTRYERDTILARNKELKNSKPWQKKTKTWQ
jgi:hypothetical protein